MITANEIIKQNEAWKKTTGKKINDETRILLNKISSKIRGRFWRKFNRINNIKGKR